MLNHTAKDEGFGGVAVFGDLEILNLKGWRSKPIDPLIEKPPKITLPGFGENPLDIIPGDKRAGSFCNQTSNSREKGNIPNLLPEHVKHQSGFLVADGIIQTNLFVVKLFYRVFLARDRIEIVFIHHAFSGLQCVLQVSGGFIIVIIGQVGGESFDPIAFFEIIKYGI